MSARASDPHVVPRSYASLDPRHEAPADYVAKTVAEAEGDLFSAFARVAARQPRALALAADGSESTYAQLEARALGVAAAVVAAAGEPGVAPAVGLLGAGEDFVVGALGALAAGGAFVPLDPALPDARLAAIAASAGVSVVLAGAGQEDRAASLAGAGERPPAVRPLAERVAVPRDFAAARPAPEQRATVFYTSGTSGRPKGVAMSHRFLLRDAVRSANDACLSPSDHCDQLFPPSFSSALVATFASLLGGACVHPFDARAWPHRLPQWLEERRITVSRMTPTLLRLIVDLEDGRRRPFATRLVSLGGEPLRAADVAAFRATFPERAPLLHAYAMTETRGISHDMFRPGTAVVDPVPAGRAVWGREWLLVGADGREVAPGEPGEIVVFGEPLADGYVDASAGEAARFQRLADGRTRFATGDVGRAAPDGRLVVLGRVDARIKVRGQIVEPGEVEAGLQSMPGVRAAAVVSFVRADGEHALAAFVVAEDAAVPGLRARLTEVLPAASIPERIEPVPALPHTPTGKVDRARLAAIAAAGAPRES